MKELVATPKTPEQKVQITGGLFREFIGTLESADPLERNLTVALSLFGRPVRVKVTREQVKHVSG